MYIILNSYIWKRHKYYKLIYSKNEVDQQTHIQEEKKCQKKIKMYKY